jgi:hypothetical protein
MDMTVTPTAYTVMEGGMWHPWEVRGVDMDMLNQPIPALESDSICVAYINHQLVHSLLFTRELSEFEGRWDCIHGWTR